jgi:hypothetical protein
MNTKRKVIYLIFSLLIATLGGTLSSCNSNKSGCPASENATVKPDRKGNFGTRKGSSSLFPKQMRKKVGVRG